ncbi:MAG: helix-turn-helix transcriptional regulator [Phycisphaerales bacterium JB052]
MKKHSPRTARKTRTPSTTRVPKFTTTNGMSDRLLTVKEVAERLGISIRTVWSLRSSGRIPDAVKIGNATRWRRSEIETYIRGLDAAGR